MAKTSTLDSARESCMWKQHSRWVTNANEEAHWSFSPIPLKQLDLSFNVDGSTNPDLGVIRCSGIHYYNTISI